MIMSEREEKKKKLDEIIARLNKEKQKVTGDKSDVFIRTGTNLQEFKPLPCNVAELNEILGGGFPRGHITTLYGSPGSGKSSIACSVAKAAQDLGEFVLYLNTEGSLEVPASMTGFNLDEAIVVEPVDHGGDLTAVVDEMLFDLQKRTATGNIGCLIVDSITNLVPKAMLETTNKQGKADGFVTEVTMNLATEKAKLQTRFVERLLGRGMLRKGTVCIFISQERANFGLFGGPTKPAYPAAVEFNSDVIIGLRGSPMSAKPVPGGKKDDTYIPGQKTTYNIKKNKINGQLRKGDYAVLYGIGMDDSAQMIDTAEKWGYIITVGRAKNKKLILPDRDIVFANSEMLKSAMQTDEEIRAIIKGLVNKAQPKEKPEPTGNEVMYELENKDEEVGE